MPRFHRMLAFALVFLALAPVLSAQQPAPAPTRPDLLFREEWKQPPYTGELNNANRRVTQAAVTNPNLELKLYGAAVREVGVYVHAGRHDLWTGMSTSPVAVMLRDRRISAVEVYARAVPRAATSSR